MSSPPSAATREGFAVLVGRDQARAAWIFTLVHARQRPLRRADRRRRLGARLVDRPRGAPGVPRRRDRPRPAGRRASRCSSAWRCCARSASSARRLGAGIMQYRMQAALPPRASPASTSRLPMEWHQRHPTGQLLSNANSDVEAAWGPIAPLPMAVGTVAMMVIAVVPDVPRRPGAGARRAAGLPGRDRRQPRSTSGCASPLMTRAQQLRAEVSEIAHESFDGAMVVKTLGREGEETERFAAKARRAARRQHPRRPDPRGVRPDAGGAAQPRRPASCSRSASSRVLNGATDAGDVVTVAYLLTIVVVPDPLDRLAARRVPAQRRRLPTGCTPVLEATGEMPYGDRAAAATGARRRPARGRATSATPTTPTSRCSTTSRSPSSPAAPSRSSAPPPPARAR